MGSRAARFCFFISCEHSCTKNSAGSRYSEKFCVTPRQREVAGWRAGGHLRGMADDDGMPELEPNARPAGDDHLSSDEDDELETKTLSLFSDEVYPTASAALHGMRAENGFDLAAVVVRAPPLPQMSSSLVPTPAPPRTLPTRLAVLTPVLSRGRRRPGLWTSTSG